MTICEGCIKQDVCKYKEEVEKYERDKLPEPLEPIVGCKYKETEPTHPFYYPYAIPCSDSGYTTPDSNFTLTVSAPN